MRVVAIAVALLAFVAVASAMPTERMTQAPSETGQSSTECSPFTALPLACGPWPSLLAGMQNTCQATNTYENDRRGAHKHWATRGCGFRGPERTFFLSLCSSAPCSVADVA